MVIYSITAALLVTVAFYFVLVRFLGTRRTQSTHQVKKGLNWNRRSGNTYPVNIPRVRRVGGQVPRNTHGNETAADIRSKLVEQNTTLLDRYSEQLDQTTTASEDYTSEQRISTSDVQPHVNIATTSTTPNSLLSLATTLIGSTDNVLVQSFEPSLPQKLLRALQRQSDACIVPMTRDADSAYTLGITRIFDFFRIADDIPVRSQELNRPRLLSLFSSVDVFLLLRPEELDHETLYAMDWCLRKTLDTDAPFGGKRVIMIGNVLNSSDSDLLLSIGLHDSFTDTRDGSNSKSLYSGHFSIQYHADANCGAVNTLVRVITDMEKDPSGVATLINSLAGSYNEAPTVGNTQGSTIDHAPLIVPTKEAARAINDQVDSQCTDVLRPYTATYSSVDHISNSSPSENTLYVYPGMRVLFTCDDDHNRWKAGTLGTVVTPNDDSITVAIDGGPELEVRSERFVQKEWFIDPHSLRPKERTRCWVQQYPLRPAYALALEHVRHFHVHKVRIPITRFRPLNANTLFQVFNLTSSIDRLHFSDVLTDDDISSAASVQHLFT